MALSLLAAAALSEYSPAFLWSPTASATDAAGGEHLAAVSGVDVEAYRLAAQGQLGRGAGGAARLPGGGPEHGGRGSTAPARPRSTGC